MRAMGLSRGTGASTRGTDIGNLLHQETKQYEPNGSAITTSVVSDTYVPRGQSFRSSGRTSPVLPHVGRRRPPE